MMQLIPYLIFNRAGTRVGRATWLYFGLWAFLFIAIGLLPLSISNSIYMVFALLSPLILLLNRLDRSGPTIKEAKATARAVAAIKEAELKFTFPYRLGERLGKWVGHHSELVRVVNILGKRFNGLSVGSWLGIFLVVSIGAVIFDYQGSQSTNGMYLKRFIKTHMIEKSASGIVAVARNAGGGKLSDSEWEIIERDLSVCMAREANLYVQSDDPYLRERANKSTPQVLAVRLMKNCGAIE